MVMVVRLKPWLTYLPQYTAYWSVLGDGGVLGALSDSIEPSLLEELPLVSVETVSVVSSVPMVDEEPGLLSDVPLVSASLLSVDGPVSGTLS